MGFILPDLRKSLVDAPLLINNDVKTLLFTGLATSEVQREN